MSDLHWVQIASFAFIAAAAIFLGTLEKFFPYNSGQKLFRRGFWLDFVWYNLAQSYVLGLTISALITWIDRTSGMSRLQILSGVPVPLQVLFFLVTHDFYIYCAHRIQHSTHWGWRIHEAHHSVKDVDWLAGVRSHPLEILINQTIEFLPIILLGAAPEVAIYKASISAVWGMWIHSNINARSGWLQYVINGPEMHRWHHANSDPKAINKNFGTKLAFWDWIFGTAYLPKDQKASEYGLGAEEFPEGYLPQVLFAFRGK